MKIDVSRLKHVDRKSDGRVTAQCPACFADGADAKGEHLVIFPDGKFGCVVNAKDKAHNRKILELAGAGGGESSYRLTIKPVVIPESVVIMKLGRLGRSIPSPCGNPCETSPAVATDTNPQGPEECRLERAAVVPDSAEQSVDAPMDDLLVQMDNEIRAFLLASVN
jgi:hypothetical protein